MVMCRLLKILSRVLSKNCSRVLSAKPSPLRVCHLSSSSIFSHWRPLSNEVTPLTTWSHNFLHYSAIIFSSLINGPSPNFQHISLWIFSHEKASIHSHNSRVSPTKFNFQEFTFCMKLPSKEFSICNHIFRDSSMEIYKFKAIISIKPL